MTRIDYYDDPDAPAATSIVPAANVVVVNDAGEILMIRRSDNGNWAVPGGKMQLGESLPEAAIREVREETGVEVALTGLTGIYTDPRHVVCNGRGDVRQECSIVFTAALVAGTPGPSVEASDARWVRPEAIGDLPMDRSMRLRIGHYLTGQGTIHIG